MERNSSRSGSLRSGMPGGQTRGVPESLTLHSCTKRYVTPAWTHFQKALYSDLKKGAVRGRPRTRTLSAPRPPCTHRPLHLYVMK